MGLQLRSTWECHRLSALLNHYGSLLSIMRRMPPTLPTFLAVYSLLYAAFGVQSPFLPALLREQGLRAEEIGIVLAASTAIRVFAGPAVGHVADRIRQHKLTLCACSFVAAVAGLGYVMLQSFAGLLLVALVQAAMLAPIVPSRCAGDNCGTHESVRAGETVRIWVAARVRLRCIHSRHNDEWLGGQR